MKKARSVRRIPLEQRWCNDCVDWVTFVPWNKYKCDQDADGDVPEEKLREAREMVKGRESPITVRLKHMAPRDFQITVKDAEKHGYTRGCPGCSSWFKGLGRQPRADACRHRFRELMKDEVRVKHAERGGRSSKRRWKEVEKAGREKRRQEEEKSRRYGV